MHHVDLAVLKCAMLVFTYVGLDLPYVARFKIHSSQYTALQFASLVPKLISFA